MSQILAIAWMRVKSILYDKKSYLFFIGLPVLFTLIFGSMIGGEGERRLPQVGLIITEVEYGIDDQWAASLYQQMQSSKDFQWTKGNKQDLLDLVQGGSLIAAVEATASEIVVWKRNQLVEHIQLEALIRQRSQELVLMNELVEDEQVRKQIESVWSNLALEYSWEPLNALEQEGTSVTINYSQASMAIGFAIMFMMMYVVTGAGIIIQEKAQGTWNRLVMAPLRPLHIFIGYGLGFVIIGWLQFAIVMIIATILFGVSWGSISSVVVIVSVFLIAVVSFGLLLSQIVTNFKQQQTIGSLFVIASSMIAGIFWPLEVVPELMQQIAKIAPQYWAFEGLKSAMLNNSMITDVVNSIAILTVFAGVFFIGWYGLYRRSLKSS